jgi:hypothetical protein
VLFGVTSVGNCLAIRTSWYHQAAGSETVALGPVRSGFLTVVLQLAHGQALCSAKTQRILTCAMRKQMRWIIGGILLLGCFNLSLAMLFRPFEGGPRYKCLPVSYWRESLLDWATLRGQTSSAFLRFRMLVGLCTNRGEPAILQGDAATLPVLLVLIRDEDSSVNNQAQSALARLPASKALGRAIVGLFKERDLRVHLFARWLLFSFGRHADRAAPSIVRELLQSEDADVRTEAEALIE